MTTALSELDTKRWGVVSARDNDVTSASLPSVLAFAREHGVELLVARCPASDLAAAQALERAGFLLMDVLVYYTRDIASLPAETGTLDVRPIRPGEENMVREMARESFRDYPSHYHADAKLDRAQCDDVYADWAHRSCMKELADEVFVAEDGGRLIAFATMRLTSSAEGEGVLFGVSPAAQGRSAYRALILRGMKFCSEHGRSRMIVSTQIVNIAVQKVWSRLGFLPLKSSFTFHKWFTR